MSNNTSQDRTMIGQSQSSTRDPKDSDDTMKPHALTVAEIESLLRSARTNIGQSPVRESDEELGPGDVQHLRGDSMTQPNLSNANTSIGTWPDDSTDPDSLLRHAEQQLSEVILESRRQSKTSPIQLPEVQSQPHASIKHHNASSGLTLDDLGNVDLDITIELGRTEILIEEILRLREGSVVSLDKTAGDPVDIVANGRLVARGELLVIDGKFGVRLSEVL